MSSQPYNVLIIRNDKLGDFMLAWPAFSLLKQQYPDCRLTALVPEYTALMAEQCEWIDDVLIDDKQSSFISDILHLSRNIKKQQFDVSISLFSEARTSISLWLAGVKTRIGPATKLAQIFLNEGRVHCHGITRPIRRRERKLFKHALQNGVKSTRPNVLD